MTFWPRVEPEECEKAIVHTCSLAKLVMSLYCKYVEVAPNSASIMSSLSWFSVYSKTIIHIIDYLVVGGSCIHISYCVKTPIT